ncbi:UNVERIFIED_CONTAM: hypothetical protein Slati_4258200 [Sesamum latifolium]|uniref:Reverse transcriptase/retrotransposon-derived protein RNase H-like domain-containing protein n=1 Tax=Sesamum latifolium TaxID=2727402 RepID=A0AAW2TBU9_9LAMI
MVIQRGIEANLFKIKAILGMKAPTNVNEMQWLTGRIAALSRFISKATEKSLPLFKVLRKAKTFEWDAPCQHAFEELKKFSRTPPTGETFLGGHPLPLSLIREDEGKQMPINYVSKVLNGAEGRYTPIEKMALALEYPWRIPSRPKNGYFMWTSHPQFKAAVQASSLPLLKARTWSSPSNSISKPLTTRQKLKTSFDFFQLIQIPREENVKADCLSKLASALENCRTRHITIQYLPKARAPLIVQAITLAEDWRTLVIRWLEEGNLPNNRWEAARLKARAVCFLLQGGFSTKNPIHTLYFDVYPTKKEYTSSRKYIVDVVEHTQGPGY